MSIASVGSPRAFVVALALFVVPAGGPALGAEQSVADIREELTLLDRQLQQVREALVATGPARGLPQDPATAFQRLDQLEAMLRRLTDRVDVLTNDLGRVIDDASNRVGDIEFRLTELEGGDVSLLGGGAPLGDGLSAAAPAPGPLPGTGTGFVVPPPPVPTARSDAAAPQFAVGEQAEFDSAKAAVEAGQYVEAVAMLDRYLATYPGGPLASEAQLLKAEALAGQGDWRGAARGYLDAFSGDPDAATAPEALYRLAVSLGRLGQTEEACLTLTEVDIRYPGSAVAASVAEERRTLACN
jgi:tol-pal system protein YbgF